MANHQSALKRIRQTERRTARNRIIRSSMRTHIKKVRTLAAEGDKAAAQVALAQAIVKIDKACTKGVIHKNQASRRVSRLTVLVNGL